MTASSLYHRYKRGLFVGLAVGALFYLAFSLYAEVPRVLGHLKAFRWGLLFPILLLSLTNYFLRFLRWEYYLRRLEVRVPLSDSLSIFFAGLSMTITPGKLGELLKSLLLKEVAGTPIARTASVVVAERLTDFLALVFLTALGIGTYYAEGRVALAFLGGGLLVAVVILNNPDLTLRLLHVASRVPIMGRFWSRLEEVFRSTHMLLKPVPLAVGFSLGTVSWFAECLGYYAVFNGHGVDASLLVCTFLYAFSTIAGVVSPGGLGVTDIALGEGAQLLVPGLSASLGVSTAFITRLATLWFAVLVGSIALLRFKGAMTRGEETSVGQP